MLVSGDHAGSLTVEHDPSGDELFEVQDPSALSPLGSEEEFTAILDCLVADFAPRLFAVVQEYGDRVDARIAAWGIAFTDRADVISVDGTLRMHLQAPREALCCFGWGSHVTPRLVWVKCKDETSVTPGK
ncbi:MAG: hypothetical protein ACRDRX_19615 [Pseudonocardiaceae bacterium]